MSIYRIEQYIHVMIGMMYNLQDEHWRIEQFILVMIGMMYNLQDEHL